MKTLALVVAAFLLAACGTDSDDGAKADAPSKAEKACAGKLGPAAPTLASVDLDGDGTPEQVKLAQPSGSCPATVFALVGGKLDGLTSTSQDFEDPPVASAYGIDVQGSKGQLLVTRSDHPRGGYQLKVYAADGADLTELKVGDESLVPFVATDVQEHPFSIDCSDDGFVFTDAVAHEPVGIVATWDVQETTYTVDGTSVTAGAPKEIADNVMSDQLGASYPELARHAAFASCRA